MKRKIPKRYSCVDLINLLLLHKSTNSLYAIIIYQKVQLFTCIYQTQTQTVRKIRKKNYYFFFQTAEIPLNHQPQSSETKKEYN